MSEKTKINHFGEITYVVPVVSAIIFLTLVVCGLLYQNGSVLPGEIKPHIIVQDDFDLLNSETLETLVLPTDENGDYAGEETYTSQVFQIEAPFSSYALKWNQKLPAATEILLESRTALNNRWTDWEVIEIDDDGPVDYKELMTNSAALEVYSPLIYTQQKNQIQYRVTLKTGDRQASPEIARLEIDCYIQPANEAVQANLLNYVPQTKASDELKIISRAAWGANEAYRLYSPDNPEPKLVPFDPAWAAAFASEMKIAKTISTNASGQELTWPLEYAEKIRKITVHHTAKVFPATEQEALNYIRALYYYHTYGRGWGDIGYHYIIDPFGNVYEGRYGGDYVVGAHVGKHNTGNIGIAIMGRYTSCREKYAIETTEYQLCEKGEPEYAAQVMTAASKEALVNLIKLKTTAYGLDPLGTSSFRGKNYPNILGHRDMNITTCPGENIYDILPEIRLAVAGRTENVFTVSDYPGNTHPDTVSDPDTAPPVPQKIFDLEIHPDNPAQISLTSGQNTAVLIKIKNTGDYTWNKNTYLKSKFGYDGIYFDDQIEQLRAAYLVEPEVTPGATGTFKLYIRSDEYIKGTFHLELIPVLNGFKAMVNKPYQVQLVVKSALASAAKKDVIALNSQPILRFLNTFKTALEPLENSLPLGGPGPAEQLNIVAAYRSVSEQPVILPQQDHYIRVALGFTGEEVILSGSEQVRVADESAKRVVTLPAAKPVLVTRSGDNLILSIGNASREAKILRFSPDKQGIMEVVNFANRPAWNRELNDNLYRETVEIRVLDGRIVLINELQLENYVKGIAEVSNSAPFEKQKAMAVIARTYAEYYLGADRKFPGRPYDLNSDPNVSQKYLGYNYEIRSPQFVKAVTETQGEVVTYNGQVVKTPYFNQISERTLSAEEVWGWTHTPYLQSVSDPYCPGVEKQGHGVGLNGCGATEMAKQGKNYAEILNFYYRDTNTKKLY